MQRHFEGVMKATIFDIERNSFVDGPGIRTTVFFKGCNLRCKWCHNPESQNFKKEILFYQSKCTGCGRCADLSVDNEKFFCLNDAKEICGREYTVQEVLSEIIKDKTFYETSGGGVTFSGGECILQIDFLCEMLKKCREKGIHTAVDTAGHVPFASLERILPFTDLFLYDVKSMDDSVHKKYTGVGNTLILENLSRLLNLNAPIWVRVPVIPGVNDTEDDINKLKAFFDKNGYPEKVELLPYHAMGEHKYTALGFALHKFEVPAPETMKRLRSVFRLS